MEINRHTFTASDISYEGRRLHAEAIDKMLGFGIEEIEKKLLERAQTLDPAGNVQTWGRKIHHGEQTWVGLSHQTLQTPYHELIQVCDLLQLTQGLKVVDLGAGYGRLGIIIGFIYPDVFFDGLELVPERVTEGNRIFKQLKLAHASLKAVNLTLESFELPEADIYFIYDVGNLELMRRLLVMLEAKWSHGNKKLVARGDGIRSLIQNHYPWLHQIYPTYHGETFSIYTF
jgi:hypothetical protein